RYFTAGCDIAKDACVAFNKKVDPANVLTKMLSKDLVHCLDSEVHYLQIKDNQYVATHCLKYVRKDPTGFRIGDIVELGVCVTTFKVGESAYITKLVLRYVTYLDGHVTQVGQ
ncbi:hypothetical protein B0H12DRAFT_961120, partial [Mycena haematopus]